MRGALAVLLGGIIWLSPAVTRSAEKDIKPVRVWFGVVKDAAKRKLAPRERFLTEAREFEKLWRAWKPDDRTPEVDFSQNVVIVDTEDKGKIDQMVFHLNDKGDLAIIVGFADAKDFPGFSFGFAQVPRTGIKSIESRPLK